MKEVWQEFRRQVGKMVGRAFKEEVGEAAWGGEEES